jgi:hypothetical protein
VPKSQTQGSTGRQRKAFGNTPDQTSYVGILHQEHASNHLGRDEDWILRGLEARAVAAGATRIPSHHSQPRTASLQLVRMQCCCGLLKLRIASLRRGSGGISERGGRESLAPKAEVCRELAYPLYREVGTLSLVYVRKKEYKTLELRRRIGPGRPGGTRDYF